MSNRPLPPIDASQLPLLMTLAEVSSLRRIGERTLQRQVKAGSFIEPAYRKPRWIFRRDDVLGYLGLRDSAAPPAPSFNDMTADETLRRDRARRQLERLKANPPSAAAPMTKAQERAFLVNLIPGVRVRFPETGGYRFSYIVRENLRPSGWPAEIEFPRDNPHVVTFDTEDEFVQIKAEATAIRAEFQEAVKRERALRPKSRR